MQLVVNPAEQEEQAADPIRGTNFVHEQSA